MEELEKNEISTQAEENTVSLASAQALADALAKIEVYTPTTWVDNSSPDIDAEHLNKPEQAIKRVTDALNSAVDVIKDLQSQVTKNAGDISTVNSNLGKFKLIKKNNVLDFNAYTDTSFREGIALKILSESDVRVGRKFDNTWLNEISLALKSDLTATEILSITPVNNYSFNTNYTWVKKCNNMVEIHFEFNNGFDSTKNDIFDVPYSCRSLKQVWFPVFRAGSANGIVVRGMINGQRVSIIDPLKILNGQIDLCGHVVFMSN